jgi:hypothetical protein
VVEEPLGRPLRLQGALKQPRPERAPAVLGVSAILLPLSETIRGGGGLRHAPAP